MGMRDGSALAIALLLASSPGGAADPQPDADETVVLTGVAPAEKRAIQAMTRSVATATDGQLARFTDAVCIEVTGLLPDLSAAIAKRIAEVAKLVRLQVARPGCTPNLRVMVIEHLEEDLAALRQERRPADPLMRAVLAQTGPAYALSVTELKSGDGDRLSPTSSATGAKDAAFLNVRSSSVLNPLTRQDINGSLVMIDAAAAIGKSLHQLADYAAFRALAQTRVPAGRPARKTILQLFDGSQDQPPELTAYDRSYIASLYKGPAMRRANAKIAEIGRAAVRGSGQRDGG